MHIDERSRALLGRIHLFTDLSVGEIDDIAKRIDLKDFARGETILHAEDTNKFMYVVLRGEVKVFQTTTDGREMILAFHCSGDSFGEISLIDQLASPAAVCAVEDSIVAIISRSDFLEIIHANSKILNNLLLSLTSRLRNAWDQNRMLHFRDATHRIRALLCHLAETRGEQRQGNTVLPMRLTHQSIADMTGLTRETVTRVIDKWKREGRIAVNEQRHLVIQDVFFEENEYL